MNLEEYLELWSDSLEWMNEPDAGERLGTLLCELDRLEGTNGLFGYCTAAVLCGLPEGLLDREGCVFRLEVPNPDWAGHENLMLAVGQFVVAIARSDFDMAYAIFLAQFDDAGKAVERTAAFITMLLYVAKQQPYVAVVLGYT